MEHICQTCLVTGIHINPMSAKDTERYRLFVPKMEDPLDAMHICVHCKGILNKLNRFIEQCRLADQLLNSRTSNLETIQKMSLLHLSLSGTVCHYLGPQRDLKLKSEYKLSDDGDDDDDDDGNDDDDIPLVKFSRNSDDYECNNYDDLATLDNQSMDTVSQETNMQTDTRRKQTKPKKIKKEARQGFSSRMVIETEEYKVIKLTLEEIKQEMKQQSNSQKYKVLPYKCEKCVRGFNFEDVLQSHMEKHSPKNGPHLCEICTQYCPSRVSLRGHMKSHSTRYKCKLCGLVRLSRQHILEHYSLQHTGSAALYSCPKCDHTTNKRTAMQRHVRLHSASQPLKCHHCGKYYKTKESLRIHIMKHDAKKLHQCEKCSSTFIYAAQLTKHMQSVHVLKDYYCVECDIMFKSMNNLKQHLQRAKRHRDDSSYKFHCAECPQKFISHSTLATHRTHAHGAAKSEACALCGRAYSSAEALRWHTQRAHTAAQSAKLPCPLCDRTFSRKYVLRAHVRTHTGERPHACECGATFAQASALRAHRTTHLKPADAIADNLERVKNET